MARARTGGSRATYILLAVTLSFSFLFITRYEKLLSSVEKGQGADKSQPRSSRLRASWLHADDSEHDDYGRIKRKESTQEDATLPTLKTADGAIADGDLGVDMAADDAVVKDVISRVPVKFEEVTISTHLSAERYDRLLEFARRWKGPIVAAVYIRGLHDIEKFNQMRTELAGVHDMVNASAVISVTDDEYPINELRNKAFDMVYTEHLLLLDIDMIPSKGLYDYCVDHYDEIQLMCRHAVLAVPAFTHLSGEVPLDFDSLKGALAAGTSTPALQNQKTKKLHNAHSCTDYDRWYEAQEPYSINYKWPCEPYIIGNKKLIPRYDERFTTYGNNKVVHIYHTHVLGFKFAVIPHHFVIHQFHKVREVGVIGMVNSVFDRWMHYTILRFEFWPMKLLCLFGFFCAIAVIVSVCFTFVGGALELAS
mmetsp:Transcript_21132/g.54931  ORF Transcript_21132/g.54931 Transcript_21132/m.54931 type:complete len:423 (-) Transcript_21132:1444-2712(-)